MFKNINNLIITFLYIIGNTIKNNLLFVFLCTIWISNVRRFFSLKYNNNYLYYDFYNNWMSSIWVLEFFLILTTAIYIYLQIIYIYIIKKTSRYIIIPLSLIIFIIIDYKQISYTKLPLIVIIFLLTGTYLFEILSLILSILGVSIIISIFNNDRKLAEYNYLFFKKHTIVSWIILSYIGITYLTNIFFFNIVIFFLLIIHLHTLWYFNKKN